MIATYDKSFINKWYDFFGNQVGTTTWSTKVELIVPKTTLTVGETEKFSIVGEITDTTTGLFGYANTATIFGFNSNPMGDKKSLIPAQPFISLISISNPDVFSPPTWTVKAFDQVPTGEEKFSGGLKSIGAEYKSTLQGVAGTPDWFSLIDESTQRVRLVNRLLSDSNHGLFTNAGVNFEIDGNFLCKGAGSVTLSFTSDVNDTIYSLLSPISYRYTEMAEDSFNLSVPITEVLPTTSSAPEPGNLTLLGIGSLGLLGYGWRRRKRVAA
jgi:hypothetical protein